MTDKFEVDAAGTEENINEVYAALAKAQKEYLESGIYLAGRQKALADEKATLLREGVEGKNVAEREANMALELEPEQIQVDAADIAHKHAKFQLDKAHQEVSRLRLIVRVWEVAAGLQRGH